MKICKKEYKHPPLIMGHIYKRTDVNTYDLYICAYQNRLISLEDGIGLASDSGFGESGEWADVTDKYCLTEI